MQFEDPVSSQYVRHQLALPKAPRILDGVISNASFVGERLRLCEQSSGYRVPVLFDNAFVMVLGDRRRSFWRLTKREWNWVTTPPSRQSREPCSLVSVASAVRSAVR